MPEKQKKVVARPKKNVQNPRIIYVRQPMPMQQRPVIIYKTPRGPVAVEQQGPGFMGYMGQGLGAGIGFGVGEQIVEEIFEGGAKKKLTKKNRAGSSSPAKKTSSKKKK